MKDPIHVAIAQVHFASLVDKCDRSKYFLTKVR